MNAQVNPERDLEDNDAILEIVTISRITAPRVSSVTTTMSGQGGTIILPNGDELKSFLVLELNEEEDLTTQQLEERGCSCEDISREIRAIDEGSEA